MSRFDKKNIELMTLENEDTDFLEEGLDLFNFRISPLSRFHPSQEIKNKPPKNKQPGKWINPGVVVKVSGVEIKKGFIYFGGQLNENKYRIEAALVDPTLQVNMESPNYDGEHMSYRLGYSLISPESRAAYIEWLAGSRDDPKTHIRYVFLYLYGIERRLLVDYKKKRVPNDERNALIEELLRLKNIYGDNDSFRCCVADLLSYVWIINDLDKEKQPEPDELTIGGHLTQTFKYLLARTVKNSEPISAELALIWIKGHPKVYLRTASRRCENEFDALFIIRYKQQFGDGLKIKPNKTRLRFDYSPANLSLQGCYDVTLNLPDITRLRVPVKKIMAVAEICTDELEPLSRFLRKQKNANNWLAALALLPGDLRTSITNPKFIRFKTWLADWILECSGLVSVKAMLAYCGGDMPLKINKQEAEMVANVVEIAGFGMAPDIRFHRVKPVVDGNIVIFSGGHGRNFSPSHAFKRIEIILCLGVMVAGIDNHIDATEVDLLKNIIKHDNQLTDVEKHSLDAYLKWCLGTPRNMIGLKARLEIIGDRDKTAIAHILVGVALADGKVELTEIKQLEKLYSLLGLNKLMVTGDLHYFSSNKTAYSMPGRNTGFERSTDTKTNETTTFSLNRKLLKVYEEETQDVHAVLESIFVEENVPDEPKKQPPKETQPLTGVPAGLDTRHYYLYKKLITKKKWSFDEVRKFCEEQRLMVDGAIEIINDWAFEHVDAPLIEHGETVFIDLELAAEIAALST